MVECDEFFTVQYANNFNLPYSIQISSQILNIFQVQSRIQMKSPIRMIQTIAYCSPDQFMKFSHIYDGM